MSRLFVSLLMLLMSLPALADQAHAKHGMILFGEKEVFASHIVYKAPHNYQVILALNLESEKLQAYRAARTAHPDEQFVYLLDAMDMKDIASVDKITGSVFYTDKSGQKHDVIPVLAIARESFKVVYFDELPLSLGRDEARLNSCETPDPSKRCGAEANKVSCSPPYFRECSYAPYGSTSPENFCCRCMYYF